MIDHSRTKSLQMVDLRTQHQRISKEVEDAVQEVIGSAAFINGPAVRQFAESLGEYVESPFVIPCGNGTDALQIAMMGLGLEPGDEVLVPAFTYVATAEVIALLGLRPVFVDVEADTFNINLEEAANKISEKTKAIVPVHLFGQCANMQGLLDLADAHDLHIIEDAAHISLKMRLSRWALNIFFLVTTVRKQVPLVRLVLPLSSLPKTWDVTEMAELCLPTIPKSRVSSNLSVTTVRARNIITIVWVSTHGWTACKRLY